MTRGRPPAITPSNRLKAVEDMICRETVDQPPMRDAILSIVRRASTRGAMGDVVGSMCVIEETAGDGRFALRTLCNALGTEPTTRSGSLAIGLEGAKALQAEIDARPSRSGVKVLLIDDIGEATPNSLALWLRSIRRDGISAAASVAAGIPRIDLSNTVIVAIVKVEDQKANRCDTSGLKLAALELRKSPDKPSQDQHLSAFDHVVITRKPTGERLNERINVEINHVRDALEEKLVLGPLPIRLSPKARKFLLDRLVAAGDAYDVRWLVNVFVRAAIVDAIGGEDPIERAAAAHGGRIVMMEPNQQGTALEARLIQLERVRPHTLRARRENADEVMIQIDPAAEIEAKRVAAELETQRLAAAEVERQNQLAEAQRVAQEEKVAAKRLADERKAEAIRLAKEKEAAEQAAAEQLQRNQAKARELFEEVPQATRFPKAEERLAKAWAGLALVETITDAQASKLIRGLPLGATNRQSPNPLFKQAADSLGPNQRADDLPVELQIALVALSKVKVARASRKRELTSDMDFLVSRAAGSSNFAAYVNNMTRNFLARIGTA